MPTVFEQYAAYRPEMTEEERFEMHTAQREQEDLMKNPTARFWEENGRRGYLDGLGKKRNFPLEDAAAQIAINRAREQFMGHPIFPDAPDITERFPGIDPEGKYCEVDMAFQFRMDRLQAALSSRPVEVQAYVGARLEEIRDMDGSCGMLYAVILEACEDVRHMDRGAKIAPNAESSQLLLERRQKKVSSDRIQRFNTVLHVLEYLSGLDPTPLTPEERQVMEELKVPIEPKVERSRDNSLLQPARLEMTFQNLDTILLQKYHTDPRSWNRSPDQVPSDIANPEVVQEAIAQYAAATAHRTIDPLFSDMERRTEHVILMEAGSFPQRAVNRGDLIIIDGKTVRERMVEEYLTTHTNTVDFDRYYEEHLVQKTNEYTAAALMGGKRVEAYVPDKDGRIPKEPVQITPRGYQPSPLKKVTLNAWERHFSRYGFFKEKVAKAAQYERMMAARERVQATNLYAQIAIHRGTHPLQKELFYGDWMREQGKPLSAVDDKLHFSITRSALPTLAVCALRHQGHSVEDIFHSNRLQKEKQEMGKEIIRRLEAGDRAWLGEVLFHGQRLLLEDMDRLSGSFDFTDEKQLFQPEHRTLFNAAATLFDAFQERSRVQAETLAAAERFAPGHGKELISSIEDRSGSAPLYFDYAEKSLRARTMLASGGGNKLLNTPAANDIVTFSVVKQLYQNQRANQPGTGMTQLCDMATSLATIQMANMELLKDHSPMKDFVMGAGDLTPPQQRTLGKSLMDGRFQERMDVQVDLAKGTCRFAIREPGKKALQQEKRQQALQQQEEKNRTKAMEKIARQPQKGGGGRSR